MANHDFSTEIKVLKDEDGYEIPDKIANKIQADINRKWVEEYKKLSYREVILRQMEYKDYYQRCEESPRVAIIKKAMKAFSQGRKDEYKKLNNEARTMGSLETPPYPDPEDVLRYMQQSEKKEFFGKKKEAKKRDEGSLYSTEE